MSVWLVRSKIEAPLARLVESRARRRTRYNDEDDDHEDNDKRWRRLSLSALSVRHYVSTTTLSTSFAVIRGFLGCIRKEKPITGKEIRDVCTHNALPCIFEILQWRLLSTRNIFVRRVCKNWSFNKIRQMEIPNKKEIFEITISYIKADICMILLFFTFSLGRRLKFV